MVFSEFNMTEKISSKLPVIVLGFLLAVFGAVLNVPKDQMDVLAAVVIILFLFLFLLSVRTPYTEEDGEV